MRVFLDGVCSRDLRMWIPFALPFGCGNLFSFHVALLRFSPEGHNVYRPRPCFDAPAPEERSYDSTESPRLRSLELWQMLPGL